MGIDNHVLKFLKYSSIKKKFNLTITVGRQEIKDTEENLKKLLNNQYYQKSKYSEELLAGYFGSTKVDSIDNNNFEKASHIHNMNNPLPEKLLKSYDTVIDGGCLEHIFNVPQALKNCSFLLKPGGQIIHILPANNFCGHGFYQFSPELFFCVYSNKNGYDETEIFLADLSDINHWYKVKKPENGKRVNVKNSNNLYILIRSVLKNSNFDHSNIQQSDYVFKWNRIEKNSNNQIFIKKLNLKQRIKQFPLLYEMIKSIYQIFFRSIISFTFRQSDGLNTKNPGLTKLKIKELINQIN